MFDQAIVVSRDCSWFSCGFIQDTAITLCSTHLKFYDSRPAANLKLRKNCSQESIQAAAVTPCSTCIKICLGTPIINVAWKGDESPTSIYNSGISKRSIFVIASPLSGQDKAWRLCQTKVISAAACAVVFPVTDTYTPKETQMDFSNHGRLGYKLLRLGSVVFTFGLTVKESAVSSFLVVSAAVCAVILPVTCTYTPKESQMDFLKPWTFGIFLKLGHIIWHQYFKAWLEFYKCFNVEAWRRLHIKPKKTVVSSILQNENLTNQLGLLSAVAWVAILEANCAYRLKFPAGFAQTVKGFLDVAMIIVAWNGDGSLATISVYDNENLTNQLGYVVLLLVISAAACAVVFPITDTYTPKETQMDFLKPWRHLGEEKTSSRGWLVVHWFNRSDRSARVVMLEANCADTSKFPAGFAQTTNGFLGVVLNCKARQYKLFYVKLRRGFHFASAVVCAKDILTNLLGHVVFLHVYIHIQQIPKSELNVRSIVCTFGFTVKESAIDVPSNLEMSCIACFCVMFKVEEKTTSRGWLVVHWFNRINRSVKESAIDVPSNLESRKQMSCIACFWVKFKMCFESFYPAAAWVLILEANCAYTSKFPVGFAQTAKGISEH
ncbi:hypothetical protein R6Q59_005518 [Mikania micrantha]